MKNPNPTHAPDLRRALQNISFQDLTLFECVAEQRSLAGAARELGLRAPFLTKAMQRLESNLGSTLLERTAKGISLTQEGLEFLQLCKSMTATMEQAIWKTDVSPKKQPPLIALAGPMFLLTHLVAPLLSKSPTLGHQGVRLIEMLGFQMISTETRGYLDAAIHYDELGWGSSWQSYPLGSVEWILCARLDHPLAKRVTEKEALRFPFVTPVSLLPQGFKQGGDHCPIPVRSRLRWMEVSNGEIGMRIVENSDQLIYLPHIQAQEAVRAKRLKIIEIKEWAPVRKTVFLSIHRDKITQHWLTRTIKTLEDGLKEMKSSL